MQDEVMKLSRTYTESKQEAHADIAIWNVGAVSAGFAAKVRLFQALDHFRPSDPPKVGHYIGPVSTISLCL